MNVEDLFIAFKYAKLIIYTNNVIPDQTRNGENNHLFIFLISISSSVSTSA